MKGNKNMLKQIIPILFVLLILMPPSLRAKSVFKNFVTVKDVKLMAGQQELYFVSMNIPNLLLIEDNMPFHEKNPWRLPNQYEIRDALLSIKQMGGRVARTYVITVKRKDDLAGTPKHILGPGVLNEQAFRVMDTLLAEANQLGVRLIIPLMDNWKWMGGRAQYADFRGKQADEFWTDPQLRADFKSTVAKILNRKNSVTGTVYKDDRAIMIWELGNELRNCPISWINEMASFIKSIDRNHLINDGIQSNSLSPEIINNPYVDVLSTHHYEGNPQQMIDHIKENLIKIDGKKPYYLGEFGFIGTQGMRAVLQTIRAQQNVCGALIWSLRFHNRDGGFYWHSEPFGSELYKAYHWPGFFSGQAYDEQGVFALLTELNEMRLDSLPAPVLLPVKDAGHISWQGATGASAYVVQRANTSNGPWHSISGLMDDAQQAYAPLFCDATARIGRTYYYRVKALFPDGSSTLSKAFGPLQVKSRWLIDNCDNYGQLYRFKGRLVFQKNRNRSFKEDLGRLSGVSGTEVQYWVPGEILSVNVQAFQKNNRPLLQILLSRDGQKFELLVPQIKNRAIEQKDYDYWVPLAYQARNKKGMYQFVKIMFTGEAQLGRVEIEYR